MKLEHYEKITDSEYLLNFFRSGDLNENLKNILKNIEKIKANNKENIIIGERTIKWTLFWKTLSQFLGLSNSYDDSRFSYVKDILIKIKNGEKVDFNSYKKEKIVLLHPNDFESELKKYLEKGELVIFLSSILNNKNNLNLKISSNSNDFVIINGKKIGFSSFWKSIYSILFPDSRGRSDGYKKAGFVVEILKKIKSGDFKNQQELKDFIENYDISFKLKPILLEELKKGEESFLDFLREIIKSNANLEEQNIIINGSKFKISTFYLNLSNIFLIKGKENIKSILKKLLIDSNIKNFNDLLNGLELKKERISKKDLKEFQEFLENSKKNQGLINNIRIMFASYDFRKGWEYEKGKYITRQTFLRRFGLLLGFCKEGNIKECDNNLEYIRELLYGILNFEINSEEELFYLVDKIKIEKVKIYLKN